MNFFVSPPCILLDILVLHCLFFNIHNWGGKSRVLKRMEGGGQKKVDFEGYLIIIILTI